jgi:hypothetical protein
MLTCDWCHKPIRGGGDKGWGFQVVLTPFHSLGLGEKYSGAPTGVTLRAHLHPEPCATELGWALHGLLADREPLETDGPDYEHDTADETAENETTVREDRWAAQREARAEWESLGKERRQWVALQVLGDDRLTAREVFERVARNFNEGAVYRSDIDPVLKRLLDAREVERVREQRGKRMLWVWSRRTALEGPIADLERALRDDDHQDG